MTSGSQYTFELVGEARRFVAASGAVAASGRRVAQMQAELASRGIKTTAAFQKELRALERLTVEAKNDRLATAQLERQKRELVEQVRRLASEQNRLTASTVKWNDAANRWQKTNGAFVSGAKVRADLTADLNRLGIQSSAQMAEQEQRINTLLAAYQDDARITALLTAEKERLAKAQAGTVKGMGAMSAQSRHSQFALLNLTRVVQDAPYGFIGIANNAEMAVQSMVMLTRSSGGLRAGLKALGTAMMGSGGILMLASMATAAALATGALDGMGKKLLALVAPARAAKAAHKELVSELLSTQGADVSFTLNAEQIDGALSKVRDGIQGITGERDRLEELQSSLNMTVQGLASIRGTERTDEQNKRLREARRQLREVNAELRTAKASVKAQSAELGKQQAIQEQLLEMKEKQTAKEETAAFLESLGLERDGEREKVRETLLEQARDEVQALRAQAKELATVNGRVAVRLSLESQRLTAANNQVRAAERLAALREDGGALAKSLALTEHKAFQAEREAAALVAIERRRLRDVELLERATALGTEYVSLFEQAAMVTAETVKDRQRLVELHERERAELEKTLSAVFAGVAAVRRPVVVPITFDAAGIAAAVATARKQMQDGFADAIKVRKVVVDQIVFGGKAPKLPDLDTSGLEEQADWLNDLPQTFAERQAEMRDTWSATMDAMGMNWWQFATSTQEGAEFMGNVVSTAAGGIGSAFKSMYDSAEKHSEAYFVAFKIGAIAEAIANTYVSATKASTAAPFPWNVGLVAGALAQGFAQVNAIRAIKRKSNNSEKKTAGSYGANYQQAIQGKDKGIDPRNFAQPRAASESAGTARGMGRPNSPAFAPGVPTSAFALPMRYTATAAPAGGAYAANLGPAYEPPGTHASTAGLEREVGKLTRAIQNMELTGELRSDGRGVYANVRTHQRHRSMVQMSDDF